MTVSWLFQGLVLHRDSLGRRQLIRPGALNLMTAGRGITHLEESAAGRPPVLHGLQLWIALPEAERHPYPSSHGYWRGAGWLAAGTSGAGRAKTPCWAVSSPAAAAASVMACGDRG